MDWPPGTEVSYVTVERLPDGQWTILQHMTAGEPIADFNKIFVITDKPDDLDALGQYTGTTSEVKYWTRCGKTLLKHQCTTVTTSGRSAKMRVRWHSQVLFSENELALSQYFLVTVAGVCQTLLASTSRGT